MVGRQTSPKCETCRKRKVKCDLLQPACSACVKSGWTCPGYSDRFISGNTKKPCKTVNAGTAPRPLPASEPNSALQFLYVSTAPTKAIVSRADSLRVEFLARMEGDVLAARLAMMPATHILKHVPSRIGLNRALDDACSCIMASPMTAEDCMKAPKLYVRALGSLRKSLDDPAQLQAPETLAAASLLQMYEQYQNHPDQQWIYHARGVVKMLQNRGPSKLSDEMEKAILEAQAGNIFMSALAANRKCFLAHPAWRQVLKPSIAPGGHLDTFMKMIMDGGTSPGIDQLCASLVKQCEYDTWTPLRHRVMIGTAALMDMLRMREQLKRQFDAELNALGMSDPVRVAAYAATGFFLITTNTILIGLHEQITKLTPDRRPQWPDGISTEFLRSERLEALGHVTARFKYLASINEQIRFTAPAALRVILATILGIGGPSSVEASTLLMVLDHGLEDARWALAGKCLSRFPHPTSGDLAVTHFVDVT